MSANLPSCVLPCGARHRAPLDRRAYASLRSRRGCDADARAPRLGGVDFPVRPRYPSGVGNLIEDRVAAARAGANPFVIVRMRSGWLVVGDVQPLPGYCLLLADPVVDSANALCEADRIQYSLDVLRVGDALLQVTGAYRINYMTLANLEPSLHTHIIPRFRDEPEEKRRAGAFQAYDWATARPFDPQADGPFIAAMKAFLSPCATAA